MLHGKKVQALKDNFSFFFFLGKKTPTTFPSPPTPKKNRTNCIQIVTCRLKKHNFSLSLLIKKKKSSNIYIYNQLPYVLFKD